MLKTESHQGAIFIAIGGKYDSSLFSCYQLCLSMGPTQVFVMKMTFLHAALFSRNMKYNRIFAIISGCWMGFLLLYMMVVPHKMIKAKMKIAIVLTEIY